MWGGLTLALHRKHGNAAASKTKEHHEKHEIRNTKEFLISENLEKRRRENWDEWS
jgi:hypothetical protein